MNKLIKPLDKATAIRNIVNSMIVHGFMSEWFGDTSDEFANEQASNIANMSREELDRWLESNKFNLLHYCKREEEFLFLRDH